MLNKLKLTQRIPARFPALAAFDQFLLLHYPRLWQTRVHVVVGIAGVVYALLLAFTLLVVRPALLPSYRDLMRGTDNNDCLSKPTAVERVQCVMPAAYMSVKTAIGETLTLYDLVCSIVGALIALTWLRAQARYSVESMHGQVRWHSAWVEWACYAVCIGLLLGGGWLVRIGLTPGAAQVQAFELSEQQGHLGSINYAFSYIEPRNLHLDPQPVNPTSTPTYLEPWKMVVEPGSPEAIHLQQLADTAYANAMGMQPPPQEYEYRTPGLTPFLPWLLIVGYGAYALYAIKRVRGPEVFIAFLLVNIICPLVLFILVVLLESGTLSARPYWEETVSAILIISMVLALGLCGLQFLRALYLRQVKRNVVLGTVGLPWVVAFVPLCLFLLATLQPARQSLGLTEWNNQTQWEIFTLSVAIAPYLFIPLLPFLDKALVRLSALPTER